jgi:hypothetical protein
VRRGRDGSGAALRARRGARTSAGAGRARDGGGDLDEREVALLNGAHERGEAVDVFLGRAGAAGLEEVLGDLEVPLAAGVVERVVAAQGRHRVRCARCGRGAVFWYYSLSNWMDLLGVASVVKWLSYARHRSGHRMRGIA